MNNKKTYTKCWDCKNISKCDWSFGSPVPGWNAIPTIINNGGGRKTKSFMVLDCPKFENHNKETQVEKLKRIAKEEGVSLRALQKKLKLI